MLALGVTVGLFAFESREAVAGYASIIVDAETGEVLRSRNADTQNYPASLTKLMTLYLLFEAVENGKLSLSSKLTVSRRATRQPPSRLGLRAGATITVEDAISALVVKSANDIAVVVAEALAGTEKKFGVMMTKKAHELGMSRTNFRNASGLPNRRQLSTARDMSRLARAMMRDFPHRYHYFGDERFRYAGKLYRTHNRLLGSYRGMDGLKTGYIRASGFNLVASAERGGRRIIAVVFGGKTARSRNSHMIKLLDMGFDRMAKLDAERGRVRVVDVPRPTFKPGTEPVPLPPVMAKAEVTATPAEADMVVGGPKAKPEVVVAAASPEAILNGVAAEGPWGIQVGAYTSLTAAEIAIRRAATRAPLLDSAVTTLTPHESQRGTLYRARFIGLYKNDANHACERLRTSTMPCVVIRNPDIAVNITTRARS